MPTRARLVSVPSPSQWPRQRSCSNENIRLGTYFEAVQAIGAVLELRRGQ